MDIVDEDEMNRDLIGFIVVVVAVVVVIITLFSLESYNNREDKRYEACVTIENDELKAECINP
jgi:hypothetical protein